MKRDLLGFQIADHFPDSINRHLIPNSEQNPAIAFDRFVDFRTFITHHYRSIFRQKQTGHLLLSTMAAAHCFMAKLERLNSVRQNLQNPLRVRGSGNHAIGEKDSPISEEAPFNRTIVRLRNAANVTQRRYGASNRTSIRAQSGRRKLKNRGSPEHV
jgi:hypothetical protein